MRISTRYFYRELSEPIFTKMVRDDIFYCDTAMSKFSLKRFDETWLTYSETLQKRFPGYILDERHCLTNVTDSMIEL